MKITWLQNFDNEHKDSIWYGGDIVAIEIDDYTVTIGAYGDIRAYINGEYYSDKGNGGMFAEYLPEQNILNDQDLKQAIRKGKIEFENNNWFEAVIWDNKNEKYIESFDTIIDDLDRNDDFKWVKGWLEQIV